ncbi:MATE family efflux transporter [Nocardiopsis sp. N85]|uniref:MATE family efflux transporter n=1 Tax=Nocardiopsis sp. N85 TaxID=3029400 RepID=UPI00237F728F|nr:MATE family efflux transporter [Nocardiopsis sp. N85]MDE3724634.1 MATE family efflux transporter [Nocardiopsis sp. N85]
MRPVTDHTRLTGRSFAGFAATMLLVEFMVVGMGAVDLLMIAPLGMVHIAALGLGDLIAVALFSFFAGLVHALSGRLAVAEGAGETVRRLPVLAVAGAALLAVFQVVGLVAAPLVAPALTAAGQDPVLVPAVADHLGVRLGGLALALTASVTGVALRVCGAKGTATAVLAVGFAANLALDHAFLYTGLAVWFSSPEAAVAWATVGAQAVMLPVGALPLYRLLARRGQRPVRPRAREVGRELRTLVPTACGIGGRHVNDYMGAVLPVLFIGTLGAEAVAATAVATRVYTLYCRLPQSCFEAAFVFYGYAQGGPDARRTVRTLTRYAGAVTAVSGVAAVAAAPWLVAAFSGGGVDPEPARWLFLAYMASLPAYFFDQLRARFLSVHRRGGVLAATSLLTYAVTVPLAWCAVFVWGSAFGAIAGRAAGYALSALFLGRALDRQWASTG